MNPRFEIPPVEVMNALLPAYDFVSLLASGDEEAVYVASQKSLDRHVAIKVYAPRLSSDAAFTGAFTTMARQMASLNHANLIAVFNSGTADGMHYLVMEFVPGRSLWQAYDGVAQEPAVVAGLMSAVCDGLAHAHDNGILHGGLSVSNILVNPKGEPKIGNFGYLASVPQALDSPWKRFVAPELLHDAAPISAAADIYSLGAIFYELMTGQTHSADAMPPQLLGTGGDQVYEVWKKATAEDPAARYANVREFKAACLAALPKRRAAAAKVAAARPRTAAAQVPSRATSAVPTVHKVGFNWKLLRNLIIIAILSYAIHLAWERHKNEKAYRAKVAAQQIEEQKRRQAEVAAKQAAEMAERKRKWDEMQRAQVPVEPPPPPPVEVVVTPPADVFTELDKLKDRLQAGDRSQLPAGAQAMDHSHWLFIERPMTWPDAAWFAEQYGAHLAIPTTAAMLEKLRGAVLQGGATEVWIGAARSGSERWLLADGSRWPLAAPPQGDGTYVAAAQGGELRAHDADVELPFILQWRQDGKNPCSLRDLAEKTRESVAAGKPLFPPGTRTFGVRNYLYVSRPVTWDNAAKIAKAAGGHLMVSRGIAENFNLEKLTGGIKAADGIWIGGFCKDQRWSWITGEAWDKPKWVDGEPQPEAGRAVVIQPGHGWVARDGSQQASGFIIEWSRDAGSSNGG